MKLASFEAVVKALKDARFVSLDRLIAMKKKARRPRDQDDIQHLDWIREDRAKYG